MSYFGLGWRFMLPVLFFVMTYNSTPYNIFDIVFNNMTSMNPLVIALVIIMWCAITFFLVQVLFGSIGKIGVGFLVSFMTVLVGLLIQQGLIDMNDTTFWFNIIPVFLGLCMGLGLVAPYYNRKITNRVSTTDGDAESSE